MIHVEYAVKMVNGVPQLGSPKSARSRRVIPIPEQFRPYVRYLREHSGTPYVWTCPGEAPLYGIGSFLRRFYTAGNSKKSKACASSRRIAAATPM